MSDLSAYRDLIARKRVAAVPTGFLKPAQLSSSLFDHQRVCTEFALRAGRSALFLDTGLGKTACALDWGRVVVERTNKPVLMLAPLGVVTQHLREAERIGVEAQASRTGTAPEHAKIVVTNYERLDRFNATDYAGVILDESSVLKSFSGVTTKKLIETFRATPFRLACSATPAPNDHAELGQHSEFLSVLPQSQMLVRWFLHDSGDTGTWRMKRHAVRDFWDWVASWARCIGKPSDIGFDDAGFEMPELRVTKHILEADRSLDAGEDKDGQMRLFRMPSTSATSIHQEKRLTKNDRAQRAANLMAAEPDEAWVVWCDTDYDADALKALMPSINEVRGSMSIDVKEDRLTAFSKGDVKTILTKPSIAGYGLNWQHCARMIFLGLSFSYENYYQAIRRCWRFRQTRPVEAHVICADTEAAIWDVVSRKSADHERMKAEMISAMRRAFKISEVMVSYNPTTKMELPAWIQ